ncbi:MAG: CoA-binding protein [Smithellaceae bacterium]|nr:CoA-binding protein [Smithellaceae bacterium]NLX51842.1 CoA-binding protein [Deltaproteobacteria bacterium]
MKTIVEQLDPIFKPRSIAVIGASQSHAKWGFRMMNRPARTGYRGAIYPVNRTGEAIGQLPGYKSVLDIPDAVDLAVITVPARQIPSVMKECAEKGVRGVVLITAGFAEIGPEGKILEDKVVAVARKAGIRFVGPNCMGIWSRAGLLCLSFDKAPQAGPIAFVSQSGTFGVSLSEIAGAKGYGLSKFISIGNQADLTAADYLEYLASDEETKVLVFYIEGFKDGERFMNLAREVVKIKPIIIYKAGRTPAGSKATQSHTASLAGSDEIFDAACRQAGLIRVQETLHAFDVAEVLASQPLPPGRRVAILGSGGQGVVTADACAALGLEVPELDADTVRSLMEGLPPHAPRPNNPVDFAGSSRTGLEEAAVVEKLLRCDYIDGVISNVPINPAAWSDMFGFSGLPRPLLDMTRKAIDGADYFASLPAKYGKPIITTRFRKVAYDMVIEILRGAGIPVCDTPEEAARAMHALVRYAEIRKKA